MSLFRKRLMLSKKVSILVYPVISLIPSIHFTLVIYLTVVLLLIVFFSDTFSSAPEMFSSKCAGVGDHSPHIFYLQ